MNKLMCCRCLLVCLLVFGLLAVGLWPPACARRVVVNWDSTYTPICNINYSSLLNVTNENQYDTYYTDLNDRQPSERPNACRPFYLLRTTYCNEQLAVCTNNTRIHMKNGPPNDNEH